MGSGNNWRMLVGLWLLLLGFCCCYCLFFFSGDWLFRTSSFRCSANGQWWVSEEEESRKSCVSFSNIWHVKFSHLKSVKIPKRGSAVEWATEAVGCFADRGYRQKSTWSLTCTRGFLPRHPQRAWRGVYKSWTTTLSWNERQGRADTCEVFWICAQHLSL